MPVLFKTKPRWVCNCQASSSKCCSWNSWRASLGFVTLFSVRLMWWREERSVSGSCWERNRRGRARDVYRGMGMGMKCAVRGCVWLRENRSCRLHRGTKICNTLNVSDQPKQLLGDTKTNSAASGHRFSGAVYTLSWQSRGTTQENVH